MENDRRRYQRVNCNGVAAIQSTEQERSPAQIVDLSVEGCHLLFENPQQIARGAEMLMTFEVNNIPFAVRAQAKSMRSDTSIGFYFPELTEIGRADLQSIVGVLAELSPQAAVPVH